MTPYEFGVLVGREKQAAPSAAAARIMNALRGAVSGLRGINQGSKHIVRGFGGGVGGLGQIIGTAARSGPGGPGNSTGMGGLFLGLGRNMQQGGKAMIDSVPRGSTRFTRDLRGVIGHGSRIVGSGVRGVGHTVNAAGEGLQMAGRGLNQLANAQYGVPTLAAAGLLGGTAAVAPKLPLPNVSFQNPIDVNFSYKTRKPVKFEW